MLVLMLITALALGLSFLKDRAKTRAALAGSLRALLKLAPSMLAMVGLVGLALALATPEFLSAMFKNHGPVGFLLITIIGSVITIPAPVAFPLAGSLYQLGAPLASLAAFITTLTMVGVVTAPMEMAYFGKRFTLVRQSLSFGLAVVIGLAMGVILP